MNNIEAIKHELKRARWFQQPGLWAVVDGQFGSTGKGLAASVLAECFYDRVDVVTSNAGPNSGHTSYVGDEKVVLQQLPTFAVVAKLLKGYSIPVALNAGAIISEDRLEHEVSTYGLQGVFVDPCAAVVTSSAKTAESEMVQRIGSTGKGTGAAIAAKVMRDPLAVAKSLGHRPEWSMIRFPVLRRNVAFMEVSQGFSLSLNASGMYPYTTSRDCTVMQGMSDAGVHPTMYRDCMMVVRTFPIRVAGNSGPGYHDQVETSWEALGVEPEMTTVTQKTRRVFTWSEAQYRAALMANRPGVVFVNFMNYLGDIDHDGWVHNNIVRPYVDVMGEKPKAVLLGYGPKNEDVEVFYA